MWWVFLICTCLFSYFWKHWGSYRLISYMPLFCFSSSGLHLYTFCFFFSCLSLQPVYHDLFHFFISFSFSYSLSAILRCPLWNFHLILFTVGHLVIYSSFLKFWDNSVSLISFLSSISSQCIYCHSILVQVCS